MQSTVSLHSHSFIKSTLRVFYQSNIRFPAKFITSLVVTSHIFARREQQVNHVAVSRFYDVRFCAAISTLTAIYNETGRDEIKSCSLFGPSGCDGVLSPAKCLLCTASNLPKNPHISMLQSAHFYKHESHISMDDPFTIAEGRDSTSNTV